MNSKTIKAYFGWMTVSFFLLIAQVVLADALAERWRPSGGPAGGTVNAIHRFGDVILAGTAGGGIYRANSLGAPWTQVQSYTPANALNTPLFVYSFASNSTAIFAVTNLGLFRSTDAGLSWKQLTSGLPNDEFYGIAANESFVVAVCGTQGVYRSTNGGTDWTTANSGITTGSFVTVANTGATFFAAAANGVFFRSIDNGQNWLSVGAGLPASASLTDIEFTPGYVFVSTTAGIYRSPDNGASFSEFSRGLSSRIVSCLSYSGTDLFAATESGVYYSTDAGLSWIERNTGFGSRYVTCVFARGVKHVAGTLGGGVFISDTNGASWAASNNGFNAHIVRQLYRLADGTVLAGMASEGGIFRSTDQGATWNLANGAPPDAYCFLQLGSKVLAGGSTGDIHISSDNGANWAVRYRGLTGSATLAMAATSAYAFAATRDGVYRTANEGGSWERVSNGLPAVSVNALIALTGGTLYAGTGAGVFVSTNQGVSWSPVNSGLSELDVTCLMYVGTNLYAGTVNGVFRKADTSSAWTAINSGLPDLRTVRAMRGLGNVLFLGMAGGVWYSLNDGQTWIAYSDGLIHPSVETFAFTSNAMLAGLFGGSVGTISLRDFDCRFAITPTSKTVGSAAVSDTVMVTDAVACGWTATSNVPWMTIMAGASGRGNGTVTFNVTANATGASRTGTLTIAGLTFTVTQNTAAPNPVPVLSSVTPSLIYEGGATSGEFAVTGSNFVSGAQIKWNGVLLATTFVSSTRLTANIPTIDFTLLSVPISVVNPAPGGGVSAETLQIVLERKVVTVSAASYDPSGTVAPNSIVAAFGLAMASGIDIGRTVPLPTALLGTIAKVKDSAGVERQAQLFFVSPDQINFLIPADTALGAAEIRVTRGDGKRFFGRITVALNAAGLFSANADGGGAPAAVILRVKASGLQSYEPVARYDSVLRKYVPQAIEFGPATDQLFLILYGTGLRTYRNALPTNSVTVGSTSIAPLFIGGAPGFIGLDQVNLPLPRSLAGRGEVINLITLDGRTSNTLRLLLQ